MRATQEWQFRFPPHGGKNGTFPRSSFPEPPAVGGSAGIGGDVHREYRTHNNHWQRLQFSAGGQGAMDEARKKDDSHVLRGKYWLTRVVFLRCLGFVYAAAFLSALRDNGALVRRVSNMIVVLYPACDRRPELKLACRGVLRCLNNPPWHIDYFFLQRTHVCLRIGFRRWGRLGCGAINLAVDPL